MTGVRRFGGEPPSPWETRFGFSRVVCAGPFVMVGGTTAADESGFIVGETPREQASEIARKLALVLGRASASFADVVSAHAYVTDISRSDEVGLALSDGLLVARPLLTMVEVSALIDPRMLVEIEVTAYLPDPVSPAGARS